METVGAGHPVQKNCCYHKLPPSSFINKVNFASLSHDAGTKLFWWIILPRTVKSAYCAPLTATVQNICQRGAAPSSQAAFSLNKHFLKSKTDPGILRKCDSCIHTFHTLMHFRLVYLSFIFTFSCV